MKKTVSAIAVGLLLIAGQAVAQNNSSTVRVGDRLGARAGESSYQNRFIWGYPLAKVVLAGAAIALFSVLVLDDSESD